MLGLLSDLATRSPEARELLSEIAVQLEELRTLTRLRRLR